MKKLPDVWRLFNFYFAVVVTELRYHYRLGKLGRRCNLNITRLIGGKNIYIGDRVTIFWGARVETITNYAGQTFQPQMIIGDKVSIGQNAHIIACDSIVIGAHTTLAANVTVLDSLHSYQDIEIDPRLTILEHKPVEIGEECLLGNGVVILPGTHLGRHCVVGANSVVRGQFGDFQVIAGIPARVLKKFDPELKKWVRAEPETKP
jgi:acetyltransferase-like isoleucine patch superfamily enzyme